MVMSMPETQGQPLPESIEEVEEAARRLRRPAAYSHVPADIATDNGEATGILQSEQ